MIGDPLGIGKLVPLPQNRRLWIVRAARRVPSQSRASASLLYCEMTGMQYEAKDASFVSRLSSKIEIGSVDDGAFQWAHELGPAEDVCGSRRHDFFVNYRFSAPNPATWLVSAPLDPNRSGRESIDFGRNSARDHSLSQTMAGPSGHPP